MTPKKPQFNADTVFPRIAHYLRSTGTEGYITHWKLVEKLVDDPIVREHASDEGMPLGIATKMVGVFSSYFTKGYTKYDLNQYRTEFAHKRIGGVWAYTVRTR